MVLDVLHHCLALHRDRRGAAVVVCGAERALRADDDAARLRNLAVGHEVGGREVVTVVPVERDRRQKRLAELRFARGIDHLHDGLRRERHVVLLFDHRALGALDAAELKSAERKVHRVACHVAERAATEVDESAPVERMVHVRRNHLLGLPRIERGRAGRICAAVRAHLRRADPRIPVEPRRNRVLGRPDRRLLRNESLRPHRTVRPHVHFLHVAENAAAHDLHAAPHAGHRGSLVAHLRHHAIGLRRVVEVLRLPERAHERLLHIAVDAHLHRADRNRRVHVVGRRNGHCLDAELLLVVKHPAVVRVERNLREHVGIAELLDLLVVQHRCALVRVRIAERHNLHKPGLQHRHPVREALAHDAHRRQTDLAGALAPVRAAPGRAEHRHSPDSAEETSS